MPFRIEDVRKHNQGLNTTQEKAWVKIANKVLSDCMSKGNSVGQCDGVAIKTANAQAKNVTEARVKQLITAAKRFGKSDIVSENIALDVIAQEVLETEALPRTK